MAEQKYSLVRARVPKRAHGRGKGVSITVEGGAPVPAPVGDHDKLANVKTLSSFRDGDKAVHLTPKQAKKLLGMMQDVNTAIGAGVSAANDFTNLTASTLTLTGSQQFIASHNSQISQLNKQEDALKDHALLSAELKALMLGFRGKVNAAMTALKALLQDKKWDDVAVQEKVTELKTMLGHYAESIALSQKSLTDRVNADAISGLQDILNQANQHANQLSASTLQLANEHTNTALAPINQSIIEQAARLDAMQKQIDGEVSHFNGEYIPTDANYPANEWTTTEDKKRHINDTFTDLRPKESGTEAGYSWKWVEESPGVFKWVVIADGGEAALLAQIAALQGAVDGKITHYLSKPLTYKKGDFWTLETNFSVSGKVWKKGSIVSAKVDSATFNWEHWENPRYISLDDIAVGGVNLIKGGKEIAVNEHRFVAITRPVEKGSDITVSIGGVTTTNPRPNPLLILFDGHGGDQMVFEISDQPQSKSITLKGNATGLRLYSGENYYYSQGQTSTWKEVKVEVGNLATAWSPAPEDVEEFTTLSVSTASINTKNAAKAAAIIDDIAKKRKEIEAEYLRLNSICPQSLKPQLLNTFTSYKGAEETLRTACNSFISGSNQTDAQYLAVIGEVTTGGRPHRAYIIALEAYRKVAQEVSSQFTPTLAGQLSSAITSISVHDNTLSQHDQTIAEHTQSITELTQNFGVEVPSILISNTQQYIQVLEEIEQQAMAKSGKVCSTIRLTSSDIPIILPCPEKFVDRQVTIARLAEPLNYCSQSHDVIYIHTTKSSSSVGVLAGGSMPFNNFVYYSQAPAFSGCKGYRINQNITGLNKFRALTEIDCNQSLSLTFLAVNYSGGHRWLLMDVSAFDAHISPNEAGTIWRAVQQVRGQEPWTIKHNGQIVPASKHSASTFTVTELMGWVEYNGSGRTTTMDFPTSLSEGFMCYVQNNARQPLTVTGCSPVGTLRSVPARSLCLCRKGTRNNMLIFQISTI